MGCGSSVQPTEQVEETGPALCEKPAAAAARKAATPEEKAAPVREEKAKASCAVRARPKAANATFLRVLSVNDVYELTNYPRLASAIKQNRAAAGGLDCVFISCLNGDFLSPCTMSALDGGQAMMDALSQTSIDYVCLGNHEFDLGLAGLATKLKEFTGKCINSNGSKMPELSELPTHELIAVGEKTALIGGFCIADGSIYSQSKMPNLDPIDASIAALWDQQVTASGTTPDVFIPMTHQFMPEDRVTGNMCADHPGLADRTPVILGGHEHEVYIEKLDGGSTILKVGADAELIGWVDIWWADNGTLSYEVTTQPITNWAADAETQRYVDTKQSALDAAMAMPIMSLPSMSSNRVRSEDSPLAQMLLTLVKDGLAQEGVELAMIQGGAFTAAAEYEAGPFTMADLFAEVAKDCPQAILKIPGAIISDTAHNSRKTLNPTPNLLHFDQSVRIAPDGHISHINHEPFDRERLYTVATYRPPCPQSCLSLTLDQAHQGDRHTECLSATRARRQFLRAGGNDVQPLVAYVTENLTLPLDESCLPLKNVVITNVMKKLWRRVLGFGGDSQACNDAIGQAIANIFEEIDCNHDGSLDRGELMAAFGARLGGDCASGMLDQMIMSLDGNLDGKIDKDELSKIAFC